MTLKWVKQCSGKSLFKYKAIKKAPMRVTCDIFCDVVDNFGDIGVTWRLAKQLVAEHDQHVRLWVNNLTAFCQLCPEADENVPVQSRSGVEVHFWPKIWVPSQPADLVIEAFGCELPQPYIDAMATRTKPSLWLNLEYLSAEDWVNGCHCLPSLQPKGLKKHFFFPGFTPQTGGLLREKDLLTQRMRFQQDADAQCEFLSQYGVTPHPNAVLISLFAYENPALPSWLEALSKSSTLVQLLVPVGRVLSNLKHWLNLKTLTSGDIIVRGALTINVIPFMSQEDYDRLLWLCDFNIVRGEDSFVRAQWAGRPFLWHIYPQQENTHLDKLEAFMTLYCAGLESTTINTLRQLWLAWNNGENLFHQWEDLVAVWPTLERHAEQWCEQQSTQTNLASAIAQFYQTSV